MQLFLRAWLIALAGMVGLHAAARPANGLVALVNDSVITYKDLYAFIGPTLDLRTRQYANDRAALEEKISAVEKEGLDELVARKLILHEFKNAGYNIPESFFEDKVREAIRERFGDRLNLTRSLRDEHMTFETFRQRVREEVIIKLMRGHRIGQAVIISPYKIEKYYADHREDFRVKERVKLRMIEFHRPANGDITAVRKLAGEVIVKLDQGVPFAEMAAINSDATSRSQGGDRGWTERTGLRKELADVAFSLKPGQHSGVIETEDALYILKVEDAAPSQIKTLPETREEIEGLLLAGERNRLAGQWIARLKAKAFIRYY